MPQLQQSRPLPLASTSLPESDFSGLASNDDAQSDMVGVDQSDATPFLDVLGDEGTDEEYAAFHAEFGIREEALLRKALILLAPADISDEAWDALEARTGHSQCWLLGYREWVLAGNDASQRSATEHDDDGMNAPADEAKNGEYSQAVWYGRGGKPLTYEQVLHAVTTLHRYNIGMQGESADTAFKKDKTLRSEYTFGQNGATGIASWGGTSEKDATPVSYQNDYSSGREEGWSYFFTDRPGKRVSKQDDLASGTPAFHDDANVGAEIPKDLYNLDLAFIPGQQSCFRAVYAMDHGAGDQEDGGVKKVGKHEWNADSQAELNTSVDGGHKIHLRVGGLKDTTDGHSLLVIARKGDKYEIIDPGHIPGAKIDGWYTLSGDQASGVGGTYKIFEIEWA